MDGFATHLLGPELGEELLRAAVRLRPDAVVIDCMAGGALSAAEHLGTPSAVLVHLRARFHFESPGSGAYRSAKEALNGQRVRLGLEPLGVGENWWRPLWQRAGRVFVASLPELEGPGAPLPETFTYVGGVFDPDPAALPPEITKVLDRGSAPLLVVSLSTTYMHQEQQLATAVEALEGRRGVVTVGGGLDPPSLPHTDGVVVTRWAQHESLFGHAAAVVCHAGHGTIVGALAAGVPLVCLPMGRDQDGNAEQVERLGAGIRVDPGSDVGRLRDAIDEVLGRPLYRARARALATRKRRLGGGAALAAEVERLADREPPTERPSKPTREE